VKAGLATASGVKIVGDVAGMWTDQVAQGEVRKWLATNPGQLDGIVVQSAAELGVLRALQQSAAI
jgi:ribose transport system substrate-binding protein